MTRSLAVVVAFLAVCWVAGPTNAATVSYGGSGLQVIGDDQVDNLRIALAVDPAGAGATFTVERAPGGPFGFGSTTPLVATAGCLQTSAALVTCTGVTVPAAEIRLAGGDDQLTHVASEPFAASVFLGDGDDEVSSGVATAAPSAGNDTIRGEAGNDILDGAAGDDSIDGGAGEDKLFGGPGTDRLAGGAGDDLLRGDSITRVQDAAGADAPLVPDALDGGDGSDTADYSGSSLPTRVRMDGDGDGSGTAGGRLAAPGSTATEGDVFTSIEGFAGGEQRDEVVGTDAANVLDGRGGDDDIDAGDGDDVVIGGQGGDALSGGSGRDEVYGGVRVVLSPSATPMLTERDENDTIDGGAGDDLLHGDAGTDALDGGRGADDVYARDGAADSVACGTEPAAARPALFSVVKLRTADFAQLDTRDRDPADCESIDEAPPEEPTVAISSARLTLGTGGRVRVRLSCPAEATTACRGRLDARLSRSAATRAPRAARGSSYSLRDGRAARISTKLPSADVRALARRPGAAATLQLTSVERGGKTVVRLVRVTYRR